MEIEKLWDTDDVMSYTGWSRTVIWRLTKLGKIPFIPGKKKRFFPDAVKQALYDMQQGGQFKKQRRSATA